MLASTLTIVHQALSLSLSLSLSLFFFIYRLTVLIRASLHVDAIDKVSKLC